MPAARKHSTAVPALPRGTEVALNVGGHVALASVLEDRGDIGVHGRRILRIGIDEGDPEVRREFEVPSDAVEPVTRGTLRTNPSGNPISTDLDVWVLTSDFDNIWTAADERCTVRAYVPGGTVPERLRVYRFLEIAGEYFDVESASSQGPDTLTLIIDRPSSQHQ